MSKPWSATPWRTKLSRFIREAVAMIRFGTPMAADPIWRAENAAEEAARLRHARTRDHHAAKIRRVHQMLAGAGR